MKEVSILLLTSSIGSGHIRAAEALEQEIRSRCPQAFIHRIDFMDRRISTLNWLLKRLYLIMLDLVPNVYDRCYKLAGAAGGSWLSRNLAAYAMYPTVKKILEKFCPDLVLCTHPFPEGTAALARRKGVGNFVLGAVLTDYCLHQIWLHTGVDIYFTATEDMAETLRRQTAGRVLAFGIPLVQEIGANHSRSDARHRLRLPTDKRALLLMGGGLGLGGMEESLRKLEELPYELVLLLVAGRNDELQERLRVMAATSHHQVHIWGYTDKIPLLMAAADLIITKPGGLTLSEAFACGLPLLLCEPIPGPESENAQYAQRQGAARCVKDGDSLAASVDELLHSPDTLKRMSKAAQKLARPQAAKDIVEVMLSMLSSKA